MGIEEQLFNYGNLFGMAAMLFPCNGILLIQRFNHGFSLCSTLRQASFPIPYFKLLYLLQHYDASEGKKKKIKNIIYIFLNKYNHTLNK